MWCQVSINHPEGVGLIPVNFSIHKFLRVEVIWQVHAKTITHEWVLNGIIIMRCNSLVWNSHWAILTPPSFTQFDNHLVRAKNTNQRGFPAFGTCRNKLRRYLSREALGKYWQSGGVSYYEWHPLSWCRCLTNTADNTNGMLEGRGNLFSSCCVCEESKPRCKYLSIKSLDQW